MGSNPGCVRISAQVQTGPGANPANCTMGTGSFPGVKRGRGVTLTHTTSSTVVTKEYSYTSTHPMGRTDSKVHQCLYRTAKTLLPLWAIRPAKSLGTCKIQLYLYSPQCQYSTAITLLPSVPVQFSYTSTPISAFKVQL